VQSQDRVGLLARNHRGFVEAMGALAVVGADIVFLNTSFAGPQLAGVVRDYGLTGVLYDADFLPAVEVATAGQPCVEVLTWGSDPAGRYPTLAEVVGDMGVPGDDSIPDPLGVPDLAAGGGRRRPPLRVVP
jgi:fatty-acyl-CoA synthase